jgi:hypothetical protein
MLAAMIHLERAGEVRATGASGPDATYELA